MACDPSIPPELFINHPLPIHREPLFCTQNQETMDGIVGMIKMVLTSTGNAEWMPCDGRLLAVADHQELFALIGNKFGGDGIAEFALPVVPPQEKAYFVIKARPLAVDAQYRGLVAQMVIWPAADLPAGWLPCDGRLIHGSDYPLLQSVVSTGAGGATMAQFHLPTIPAQPGLNFIICVEGEDPRPSGSLGGVSDDDY
jgi:microcystin-dependent protein